MFPRLAFPIFSMDIFIKKKIVRDDSFHYESGCLAAETR